MSKVLYGIRHRSHRFGGEPHSGWLPSGASNPLPTPVSNVFLDFKIVQEGPGSFLLVWMGPEFRFSGDTWHPNLREAMDQAALAFGIGANEWSPVQA